MCFDTFGDFSLAKKMDQTICIKFCTKNKIKCSGALQILTVTFGESTLSEKKDSLLLVQAFYKRPRRCQWRCPGRPSTSTTDENVAIVKKIVTDNSRITIMEIAENVGISIGSRRAIFSDVLDVKHMTAKFVPKSLLNFDQKKPHIE